MLKLGQCTLRLYKLGSRLTIKWILPSDMETKIASATLNTWFELLGLSETEHIQ